MIIEYILIGSLVGFMSGALGTGGGLLLVPFISISIVNQHLNSISTLKVAVATSLAIIFFTSLSSTFYHIKKQSLNMNYILPLMLTTVLGGLFFTPVFSYLLPKKVILILFFFMSLMASYKLLFQKKIILPNSELVLSRKKWILSIFGFPIGGLCGVLGVSGGGMLITLLRYFNFSSKQMIAATACLSLSICFSTELSYFFQGWGGGKYYLGYIYLPAFFFVTISGVTFSYLGGKVTYYINTKILKTVLAIILLIASAKLFLNLF